MKLYYVERILGDGRIKRTAPMSLDEAIALYERQYDRIRSGGIRIVTDNADGSRCYVRECMLIDAWR